MTRTVETRSARPSIRLTLALSCIAAGLVGCGDENGGGNNSQTQQKLGVTVYARVVFINDSMFTVSIPSDGVHMDGHWWSPEDPGSALIMPDGSPPLMIGPGQSMVFGSKSNNSDITDTSGTGGTLNMNVLGAGPAHIHWSVPWLRFNGGLDECDGDGSMDTGGGSTFQTDANVSGGRDNEGNDTCQFVFGITGGSIGAAQGPLMAQDQALAWNTEHSTLVSADGSTWLSFGANHALSMVNFYTGATWTNNDSSAIVTIMQEDGNLVSYDVAGNPTWSTNTWGHPGATMSLNTSEMDILSPQQCVGAGRFHSCFQQILSSTFAQ